jgi:hypothetical protein
VRALYTAGTACILAFLCTIAWQSMVDPVPVVVSVGTHATPSSPQPATSGRSWFQATKPYCNSLEVETRLQSAQLPRSRDPAPIGTTSGGRGRSWLDGRLLRAGR